ncbi:MAG: sulfatase-like hydrolase/transferase [Verrucomicrobiae bacterium]|nr:sulfatase-like hydrolase/transferase [Verrucomicrobiae bacterium]
MRILSLLSFLLLSLGGVTASEPDRPNIILLMGDDHGWEETGYNGHPYVKTPVLDEMAKTGLRLDRFYSGHPSCSPTRGSVMTGRHPNRYGTFAPGWSLRPEEITIAKLLHDHGYVCGHFGKWHLGAVKAGSPVNPGAMGFDTWVSHDNFFELNPYLSRDGAAPERFEGESSAIVIEEARKFIDRSKGDGKPFFAVVWFGSPHEPYSGLPEDLALYDDLPAKYADRKARLTSNETGLQVERPKGEVLRERYAEITAMDRSIGMLRDYLKAEGLRDNTLVWYCGDNGTDSPGQLDPPFRGVKGQMYEGGIRVPGLIEWPARIPAPRVSRVNAVTSDILPTLCGVARVPLPDRPLDGISLAPVFDGFLASRPTPIFFWSFNPRKGSKGDGVVPWIDPVLQQGTTPLVKLSGGKATRDFLNVRYSTIEEGDYTGARVILDGSLKLVVHDKRGASDASKRELFDLDADPLEKHDLSQDKPEVAKEMAERLRAWQDSVLKSLTGADYGS